MGRSAGSGYARVLQRVWIANRVGGTAVRLIGFSEDDGKNVCAPPGRGV